MSEERFDRLEKMMEQLITMVGHNNAVTEELRQRVDGLDKRMDGLDQRMDALDQRMDGLDQRMDGLEAKMATKNDIARLEKGIGDIIGMVDVNQKEVVTASP